MTAHYWYNCTTGSKAQSPGEIIQRESESPSSSDLGVWLCENERKRGGGGGGGVAVLWRQTSRSRSHCLYQWWQMVHKNSSL